VDCFWMRIRVSERRPAQTAAKMTTSGRMKARL
jgi:hypothetical protein